MAKNVLGTDLEDCSRDPLTGYYRDGCCNTGPGEMGVHTVCDYGFVEAIIDYISFNEIGVGLNKPDIFNQGLSRTEIRFN